MKIEHLIGSLSGYYKASKDGCAAYGLSDSPRLSEKEAVEDLKRMLRLQSHKHQTKTRDGRENTH